MRSLRAWLGLFWYGMALTLLLLLPMAAAVDFFALQRQQQLALRQAAGEQEGVPVEEGAQCVQRLLLAVQGEEPEFLLVRVDAPAQSITLCALEPDTLVQAPAGLTTLADCYMAAGPARAAQLLGQTVGAAPDHYFAATPDTYATLVDGAAPLHFALEPWLPARAAEKLRQTKEDAEETTAAEAEGLLRSLREAGAQQTELRAALWAALLQQDPSLLTGLTPAARQAQARTLTDLDATALHRLEQAFAYLAPRSGLRIGWEALPTVPAPGGRSLEGRGAERAAELLG